MNLSSASICSLFLLSALGAQPTLATKARIAETDQATPPQMALRAYISRVRAQQAAEIKTSGSIWSPEGRLVRLGTDAKAARVHDVVSIVVSESLAASTDGQVKNSRASNANSSLTALFGALKASKQSAEPGRTKLLVGIDGAGSKHDQLQPGDHIRRRSGRRSSQRDAGGSGDSAADLLTTDTIDQTTRSRATGRCQRAKPGAVDSDDGS